MSDGASGGQTPDGGYFAGGSSPAPPPPPPPPPGSRGWGAGDGGGGHRPGTGGAGVIPASPLSLGQIIDVAIKLFRATAAPAIVAVAVVYGPLQFIGALLPGPSGGPMFGPAAPPPSGGEMLLGGLTTLALLLVAPLVTGAVTWLAVAHDRGLPGSWQDAYRAAGTRYPRLLGTAVLVALIAFGAIVAVAIPSVLLALAVPALGVLLGVLAGIPVLLLVLLIGYLVVPVVLFDDLKATAAVRRSVTLVRPRVFPGMATVLVAGLLIAIVGLVVSFGFEALAAFAGPAGFLFAAIGGTLASVITVPLTANVALLIYVDARLRQDPGSLDGMFAQLPRPG